MQNTQKRAYAEPVLVKREQLRDVTAGNGSKYREKLQDKLTDLLR